MEQQLVSGLALATGSPDRGIGFQPVVKPQTDRLAPAPIPRGLLEHPGMDQQLVSGLALATGSPDRGIGLQPVVKPQTDRLEADPTPSEPVASASPLTETLDIETALIPLRRYSLLGHRPGDPADSAGRVHRVVQLVTREQLDPEPQRATLTAMLAAVNKYTPTESGDVRTCLGGRGSCRAARARQRPLRSAAPQELRPPRSGQCREALAAGSADRPPRRTRSERRSTLMSRLIRAVEHDPLPFQPRSDSPTGP